MDDAAQGISIDELARLLKLELCSALIVADTRILET
jgi:hypothetical protein